MGLIAVYGSISIVMVEYLYITHPIPSIAFIPYAYTTPVIREVYLNGERQNWRAIQRNKRSDWRVDKWL